MADDRQRQQRRRPGGRPPSRGRVRVCPFCADPEKKIDYKDVATLEYFLADRGKIKPRRKAGTCARHQRQVAREIKRARHLALLPFSPAHSRT